MGAVFGWRCRRNLAGRRRLPTAAAVTNPFNPSCFRARRVDIHRYWLRSNPLRGDSSQRQDHRHTARCPVGTCGVHLLQSRSRTRIAASTSESRGGRLASAPALVGGDGDCDRPRNVADHWEEAILAARILGALCLLLPHLIGAPAASGLSSVPGELVRRFTIASLATSGVFWFLVGTLGGLIYSRNQAES